jgi:hypothetical protein
VQIRGRAKTSSVIDGQQRLTTLQILFAALRKVGSDRIPTESATLTDCFGIQAATRMVSLVSRSHRASMIGRRLLPLWRRTALFTDAADGIRGAFNFFRARAI